MCFQRYFSKIVSNNICRSIEASLEASPGLWYPGTRCTLVDQNCPFWPFPFPFQNWPFWPFTVLTVYHFAVYRFDCFTILVSLFCIEPFDFHWPFCRFVCFRFAVLPFCRFAVLPFCRSVSPFCRSRFAVLANSVLIPFTVLTAESLIKSIPFCRFRLDRFDAHLLLPIWKFPFNTVLKIY